MRALPLATVVACAILLGACADTATVLCANGRTCPAGYTCASAGCQSPAQVAACSGVEDGGPCVGDIGAGVCIDGGCLVAVCSNRATEHGEVCDDGNNIPGDGCNATCTSLETCGNGLIDFFVGEECDCGDGVTPGPSACGAQSNGDALCNEVCTLRRCGDGRPDPGEVCDDGNNLDGDGCASTCSSNEACGNGIVDVRVGDACDDGNTRNLDGCSATCQPERFDWREASTGSRPDARGRHTLAYDSARKRAVMLGGDKGFGGPPLFDTWELADDVWQLKSVGGLPARSDHGAAYDAARQRVVVFGGRGNAGVLADTWEFDGVRWTQLATIVSPPARARHAMAYDAARDRIVMFGGADASGAMLGDTWELTGTTWVQRTTSSSPSARGDHAMVFDSARGKTLLFGGFTTAAVNDVWELDGTTWTQRLFGAQPSPRWLHAMAYDAARNKVVVFGGFVSGTGNLNETWELDSDTELWTNRTSALGSSPTARYDHAMAFDLERGAVVLFSGSEAGNDTWELGATAWVPVVPPSPLPPARQSHAIAHDLARGISVMFGGVNVNTLLDDTWEHDGVRWIQTSPASSPPARSGHRMVYDAARKVIVLFGGHTGSVHLDDHWEYNGTTWVERTIATPPPRMLHGLAYDTARMRVVLFGGNGPNGTGQTRPLADTWELVNGTTWLQITPTVSPPARESHALAYDSKRERTVLFGGGPGSTITDETWEYDGATWVNRFLPVRPPPRKFHMMAYDAGRHRTVVTGGTGAAADLVDVWELDASGWTQHPPNTPITARDSSAIAYDARRAQMLLFGGFVALNGGSGGSTTGDTWSLGYAPIVSGEVCSAGGDYDRDGLAGCIDDECWPTCAPTCSPGTAAAACLMSPACGDGTCDGVETVAACPGDCP